jgi:hypothetical protein
MVFPKKAVSLFEVVLKGAQRLCSTTGRRASLPEGIARKNDESEVNSSRLQLSALARRAGKVNKITTWFVVSG